MIRKYSFNLLNIVEDNGNHVERSNKIYSYCSIFMRKNLRDQTGDSESTLNSCFTFYPKINIIG